MVEHKVFKLEEVNYIYEAVRAFGCADETDHARTVCPFWSWELKNEKGDPGACSCKTTHQLCHMLALILESESLVLSVREKDREDYLKDLADEKDIIRQKQNDLAKQKDVLDAQIQVLHLQIRSLEFREKNIDKKQGQ